MDKVRVNTPERRGIFMGLVRLLKIELFNELVDHEQVQHRFFSILTVSKVLERLISHNCDDKEI